MNVDDRIADPWGTRTPFAAGDAWPVRVDEFTVEQPERWVQSASLLHSNGDAIDIGVRDGRIVGVRGRAADRVNRGRLDPKDVYGWQANASPDRLTRPLVRDSGKLVEAGWDEAMRRIVDRSKELVDGPGGWGRFGFYTTGQLFLEEYYTLGVIGKAGLGTTASQPPTPTSISATRSRCGGTTWPRRRPCYGCGCSTGAAARTRRRCWPSTRGPLRSRARPTSIWPSGPAPTSR